MGKLLRVEIVSKRIFMNIKLNIFLQIFYWCIIELPLQYFHQLLLFPEGFLKLSDSFILVIHNIILK